ncbi:MAG: Ig-like domain repeat protein, partial [Thermoproteus sp.]
MPHTSKVIALTLISVLSLLTINIYAELQLPLPTEPQPNFTITPALVNMNTYTNLTIIFKNQININNTKINISNALIIFEKVYKNIVNIGIYPTGDNVVVSINGTEKILDVANICNINYINSYNYSQSIFINVSSTCSNLNEYINGMRVPINSVYRPPYSGIYYVILTNGSYYVNVTYIVSPKISTNITYYGQWLNISLNPPLYGSAVASIGGFNISTTSMISIPPFALAAGNYTLTLSQNGVLLLNTTIEILKAIPKITIKINNTVIYGITTKYSINSYIFNNYYRCNVSIFINGSLVASGTTPMSLDLPLLDVGTYNLTVIAHASANTTQSSAVRLFRVLPAPVNLRVYVNGSPLGQVVLASYGQILLFNATASSTLQPTGRIVILVDGKSFGAVVDTLMLGAGLHNVTVAF